MHALQSWKCLLASVINPIKHMQVDLQSIAQILPFVVMLLYTSCSFLILSSFAPGHALDVIFVPKRTKLRLLLLCPPRRSPCPKTHSGLGAVVCLNTLLQNQGFRRSHSFLSASLALPVVVGPCCCHWAFAPSLLPSFPLLLVLFTSQANTLVEVLPGNLII
jgi:hypothetical protein